MAKNTVELTAAETKQLAKRVKLLKERARLLGFKVIARKTASK